jgi:hypothetical protein
MLSGYKTFLTALAITIFGALEALDFTQFLNAETAGIVTTVIGVIMAALRFVTKTPPLK